MGLNRTNTSPTQRKRTVLLATTGVSITNIAAAKTDLAASLRIPVDLSAFDKIRLNANVTTATAVGTPELRAEYSTDGGSTWAYFDSTGSGPAVSTVGTGVKFSEWETIPAAAQKSLAIIRLVTIGGDGAEDPVLGSVVIELA